MLDRIRELVDRSENESGDDRQVTVAVEVDSEAAVRQFRQLLRHEGVSVDDESKAVEEFTAIVSQYDDVAPKIRALRSELSDDGSVSLLDVFENEAAISRWRREYPDAVNEFETVREQVGQLFENRVDVDDQLSDEGLPDEVEAFLRQLSSTDRFVSIVEGAT
jgi:hypothetical protein